MDPLGGWRKELQSGVLTNLGSPVVVQLGPCLGLGVLIWQWCRGGVATFWVAVGRLLKWCEHRSRVWRAQ